MIAIIIGMIILFLIIVQIYTGNNCTTTQGQLRSSQGGVSLGGYTTGEVLASYDIVYIKAADGKIWKANATNSTKMLAIGMVLEAHGTGDTNVFVHALGLVTNTGWAWTAQDKLYVSKTVDGGMTITVPNTTGNIAQVIAVAISATKVIVCCAYPWVEVS